MSYVVQCKGCREIIPASVEILPTQSIAVHCPRCDGHWRYIPSQIFWEQAAHVFDKKPVRTAEGRTESQGIPPDTARGWQAHDINDDTNFRP
jgi:hypothetical protein